MALKIYASFLTGVSYYSYVKRLSDNFYYDTDDATFKAFAGLVDGQIEFTEDSDVAGEFSWTLTLADGDYIIYTKKSPSDGNAASAYPVTIKFGNEVVNAHLVGVNDDVVEVEIVDEPVIEVQVVE